MEVLGESLAPGVENRGDPDRAAKVPRITPEGQQRVSSCAEEERVDHARITLRERVERVREREDDVEVRNRQEVSAAGGEPPFLGEGLALRAMPIATGVVRDPHRTAAVTRLPVPAENGGAAGRDRPERPVLDRREPVRPTIALAMGAHNVGELKPRPDGRDRRARRHDAHGSTLRRRGKPCQEIERGVGADLRMARQLEVAGRRTDVAVSEQALNGVDVDASLEEVRRERVPQPVNAARLRDARAELREVVRPLEGGGMQGLPGLLRRKQPGPWPRQCPVRAERIAQPGRQHGVPVLASLALFHAQRHPRRINVGHAQMQHFV